MTRAKRERGFTLIELLVVIIIIIIIASVTVALMNVFFRGQGVRTGESIVRQAVAQTKTMAADKRVMHFCVFENTTDGGQIRIFQDTGSPGVPPNRFFDNPPPYNMGPDQESRNRPFPLPKAVGFQAPYCPAWIGIDPSGYCIFSPTAVPAGGGWPGGGGFTEIQAGAFEASVSSYTGGATPPCDIAIVMQNRPYRMVMDVDRAGGKVRRAHFLAQ
jgi:prepilin-type N-terminal cleavage/methylation domain-containing protein